MAMVEYHELRRTYQSPDRNGVWRPVVVRWVQVIVRWAGGAMCMHTHGVDGTANDVGVDRMTAPVMITDPEVAARIRKAELGRGSRVIKAEFTPVVRSTEAIDKISCYGIPAFDQGRLYLQLGPWLCTEQVDATLASLPALF